MPRDRRFQDRHEPQDEGPIEPPSRLPMQPWMKYTGISLPAAMITWFRIPRSDRQNTIHSAFMAMLVFAAVAATLIGVIA